MVLKDGVVEKEKIPEDIRKMIRESIGSLACYRNSVIVSKLPKTRSGKILRNVLRKIANGQDFKVPPTIEDTSALSECQDALSFLTSK